MKSMKSIVAAAAVLSAGLFGSLAHGRAIIGYGGKPLIAAEATCFGESWGTVTNNCSGSRTWVVPLVVDPAGNYNPGYEVRAASAANTIHCQSIGINDQANWYYGSADTYPSQVGATLRIYPGSVTVPAGGALYGACWIGQGSKLNNVVW